MAIERITGIPSDRVSAEISKAVVLGYTILNVFEQPNGKWTIEATLDAVVDDEEGNGQQTETETGHGGVKDVEESGKQPALEITGLGWEILITRQREDKRGSSRRTVGTYQVFHDGQPVGQLSGMVCEPPGPGDNSTYGNKKDLRVLAGKYPLYTQAGTKYKTLDFTDSASSSALPRPGIELMETGDRTEILLHPAQGFLWSEGCINVTENIADASADMNFVESRRRVIALIDDMKHFLGADFPSSNGKKVPRATAIIRNASDMDAAELPPSTKTSTDLLSRLVTVYAGENIRHPRLKAVSLAQWLLESGRATSKLATDHYNFGGLKWRSEMAPFATKVRYEAHDGVDDYCKFSTLESFVNGYWAFINRSPYSGWETHTQSAEDYIRFIGPIYAPKNPLYADHILDLVPEARSLLEAVSGSSDGQSTDGSINLGTIVIDPGHGGTKTNGGSSPNNAISVSGVKEKKLTLDFALILKQALIRQAQEADEKINVVLTRETDVNPGIAERAQFAFANRAKLFLSIHFNGHDPSARGTETFYRAPENGNLNLEDDKKFAGDVQAAVFGSIRKLDSGAKDRKIKPDTEAKLGAIGVLNDKSLGNDKRQDMCRAALLEIEFISNPVADNILVSGSDALPNRTRIMEDLAKALRSHLKTM